MVAEDPECRVDADCFSGLACIRDRCQNPCTLSNPCRAGQKCVVEDTLPLRTMACICPDGFYIGDSGECIQGMGYGYMKNCTILNLGIKIQNLKVEFKTGWRHLVSGRAMNTDNENL